MSLVFPLILLLIQQIVADKNVTHSIQERQSALEVLAFVGVPLVANYLSAPGPETLAPKPDSKFYPDYREEYLHRLELWLSQPLTDSGRGQGCTSGKRSTQTRTTSTVSSSGRLQFSKEQTSSMMAPGGDDPRKPPTPPPKRLPAPYVGARRRKRPRLDDKHPAYIVDLAGDSDEGIEVVNLEGDVIVIDDGPEVVEVFAPVASTSSIVLETTTTCPDSTRPASTSSSNSIMYCEAVSSSSENSNGPEEIVFMTGVPELRPYPGTDWNPRGSNRPITPYWRGLMWGTSASKATNTCVMDSFFSHVIYLGRRFPRYFRIHLNAARNEPEMFILYLTQHTEGQSKYTLSQCIHHGWNRVVAGGTFPISNGVINMVGSQEEAVFSHLRQSDRIWLIHQCGCDIPTRVDIRRDRRIWTAAQVQALSAPAEEVETKRGTKKCKECKGRFRYMRALVSQATWFHSFNIPRTVNSRDGYPMSIEMQEIGTNAIVHFDLGYFAYVSRASVGGIRHYTSVHVIQDQGTFYYNGMAGNGELQTVPANLDATATLESVVYFRRYDEGRPR